MAGQHRNRLKLFCSYALMAGGSCLLFLGTREILESRFGQVEAARGYEDSVSAPRAQAPQPLPSPRRGDTVARLLIPRLDTQLYVLEGDGPRELRRGPGHLSGTAMPGDSGNCVIAGHRDTHFRVLKDIHKGDEIVLETAAGRFVYRVLRTSVVSPKNTSALRPTKDSELNLITCYPFYYVGSAPKRFVVDAQLAGPPAVVGEDRPGMPIVE